MRLPLSSVLTRTLSDMGVLDKRLYTSPHASTDNQHSYCDCSSPAHPHALRYGRPRQAPVYLASRTYGRTGLREARLPRLLLAKRSATEFTEILYSYSTPMYHSHRSTQYPHPPTGSTGTPSVSENPDEPLLHFGLCRPRRRQGNHNQDHRAFPVTRSGAGVDLPGVGRRDMSDQEDTSTAPAARGGSSSRARPRRDDDRSRPWNRRDFIPADDPGWARCTVKKHEDFPRHLPPLSAPRHTIQVAAHAWHAWTGSCHCRRGRYR